MQPCSYELRGLLQGGDESELEESDREVGGGGTGVQGGRALQGTAVSSTPLGEVRPPVVLLVLAAVAAVCIIGGPHAATVPRKGVRDTAETLGAPGRGRAAVELTNAAVPVFLRPLRILDFIHAAFPGELSDLFLKWSPAFQGAQMRGDLNCASPYPAVYFNNKNSSSYALFHNLMYTFPMAMEYTNSSNIDSPMPGQKQAVLGFAEMLWPYYAYNGNLGSPSPYLVFSMDANSYSEPINFEFVECAMLGWPAFPQFAPPMYPLRIVLKNPRHGKECLGWERGHAQCDLRTSWGLEPADNNWRNTAKEVNTIVQLCMRKYGCEIMKAEFTAADGKETPQIFLFRVLPGVLPELLSDEALLPFEHCGLVEPGVDYGLDTVLGGVTNATYPNFYLDNVPGPEKCCNACHKAATCKTWTWMGDTSRCWLGHHDPKTKVPRPGCVSGQFGVSSTTTTTTSSTTTTTSTSPTPTTTTVALATQAMINLAVGQPPAAAAAAAPCWRQYIPILPLPCRRSPRDGTP